MKSLLKYLRILQIIVLLFFLQKTLNGQIDPQKARYDEHIFFLMQRTDLSIYEIEVRAEQYFQKHGKGKGSGYKQYQRWLYERKFYLDDEGYYITPNQEAAAVAAYKKHLKDLKRDVNDPWTELGPSTWTHTSGWNPGIGHIISVAVHPSNQSIIYESSPGGGIWKNTNSGNSWSSLMDDESSAWMSTYNLHIDPSNVNTIYAAVIDGGVIKSTNGGTSWSATGSGPNNTLKVIVHPSLVTQPGILGRPREGIRRLGYVGIRQREDI